MTEQRYSDNELLHMIRNAQNSISEQLGHQQADLREWCRLWVARANRDELSSIRALLLVIVVILAAHVYRHW
jgi:hypothetical protein